MKRKYLIWMFVLAMSLLMTGCGKSKEEKELEAIQKELEEAGLGELNDLEKAIIAEELALQAEKEAQAEIQGEYKVYDSVAEWDTIEDPLLAAQIDDTLYELGVTVEQFLKQVDSSSIEYEIGIDYQGKPTYTEDMIVDTTDVLGGRNIDFYRDGVKWFSVYYYNPTDSIISVNDCICYRMESSPDAMYNHVKVLNMSYDEWSSIKFDEVETKMQTVRGLEDCEVNANGTDWTYSKDIVKEINGKRYLFEVDFIIKVDTTTGKINLYGCNIPTPKEFYDLVALESLENLPLEAWDSINKEIAGVFENNKNKYTSMKLVETALYKEYDSWEDKHSEDITLRIYCEAVTTDGQTVYMTGSIINPLLADGTFVILPEYSSIMLFGAESSLERCINTYEKSDNMELGRVSFE